MTADGAGRTWPVECASPEVRRTGQKGIIMASLAVIHPQRGAILEDNRQWTNRFQVHSETSDRVYIVAQHKTSRFWGCSCFGWIRFHHCKHLRTLGLPGDHKPFEALLK